MKIYVLSFILLMIGCEVPKEDKIEKAPDNLLLEPDDPDQEDGPDEASGAAAVAGVTVPLGAGPTYHNKPKKKQRKKNRK